MMKWSLSTSVVLVALMVGCVSNTVERDREDGGSSGSSGSTESSGNAGPGGDTGDASNGNDGGGDTPKVDGGGDTNWGPECQHWLTCCELGKSPAACEADLKVSGLPSAQMETYCKASTKAKCP